MIKAEKQHAKTFSKSIILESKLDPTLAKQLVGSMYHRQLLIHKLLEFSKDEKGEQPFLESELLTYGQEVYAFQRDLEGDTPAKHRITQCQLTGEKIYTVSTLEEYSAKHPFTSFEIRFEYSSENDNPEFTLSISCTTAISAILTISQKLLEQSLSRIVRFAQCAPTTLESLKFIDQHQIVCERKEATMNSCQFKHQVHSKLNLGPASSKLGSLLTQWDLLLIIFSHDIDATMLEPGVNIELDDTFTRTFNNMQFSFLKLGMEKSKKDIAFEIVHTDQQCLKIISAPGISNFHQFGFEFKLEEINEHTFLNIKLLYSQSAMIGVAGALQGAMTCFSSQSSTKPSELETILKFAARGQFITVLRHLKEYLNSLSLDQETKDAANFSNSSSHTLLRH